MKNHEHFLGLNIRMRRIASGVLGALMLVVMVISSVVLAEESDHDCSGSDCPICQEIQCCLDNFQLMGCGTGGEAVCTPTVWLCPVGFAASDEKSPAVTLRSLYVRFNE